MTIEAPRDPRGVALVVLGGAMAGVGNLFAKVAADQGVTPSQLAAVRGVAGLCILIPLVVAEARRATRPWSAWPRWLGIAPAYAASTTCYLFALTAGEVTAVMPLAYTYPALAAAVATWVLKNPLTRRQLVAIVLGVAGAAFLFGTPTLDGSGTGRVLALVCAAFAALYYVGLGSVPADGHRMHGLAVLYGACAIVFVPIALVEHEPLPVTATTLGALAAFVILGAMLVTMLTVAGIQAAGVASGATATLAEPLVLVLLAVVVLGEDPALSSIIGGTLVVIGLALVARDRPLPVTRDPQNANSGLETAPDVDQVATGLSRCQQADC
jgi:drug/metabolite transporter (DMT)-like permease